MGYHFYLKIKFDLGGQRSSCEKVSFLNKELDRRFGANTFNVSVVMGAKIFVLALEVKLDRRGQR